MNHQEHHHQEHNDATATTVWSSFLISSKLVHLLPFQELKNMCAVSRTWPPETLRNACMEKLDSISHVHLRDWERKNKNPRNVTDFCKAFPPEISDTDWPFTNTSFKISANLTTGILEEPYSRVAAFSHFFLTYGKQISSLECSAYCTTPQNLRRLHQLFSQLHPDCEVRLKLDIRPHEDNLGRKIHPSGWEQWGNVLENLQPLTNVRYLEIQDLGVIGGFYVPTQLLNEYVKIFLHCFPNLRSIKERDHECDQERLLSVKSRMRSYSAPPPPLLRIDGTFNVHMPYLTELDVHLTSLGDYGIIQLAKFVPIQLIKLKLKFHWVCRNHSALLEQLLQRISGTLKFLSLSVGYGTIRTEGIEPRTGVPNILFPPGMPALQSLSLLMFWDKYALGAQIQMVHPYDDTFERIVYPTQFPQLKDLSFKWENRYWGVHPAEDFTFRSKFNDMFLPPPPAKCETVKKVYVGNNAPDGHAERPAFVDRMRRVFPNAQMLFHGIQQQYEINYLKNQIRRNL